MKLQKLLKFLPSYFSFGKNFLKLFILGKEDEF